MIQNSETFINVFLRATADYHNQDDVDTHINNPYEPDTLEYRLYLKNWIDVVQWHLEDLIRAPHISDSEVVALKRRIDHSNQERTDLVEQIDSYFLDKYCDVNKAVNATINTESPAWAIDRLSILVLKIWHMQIEAQRSDASQTHREACQRKLAVLEEQKNDLSTALDQLLDDLAHGRKFMKVYRQMKMYNDPALNPALYGKCNKVSA